jgi:rod shape-determining protein MreC
MTQNGFYSFSDGVRSTTALYLNLINIKRDSQKLSDENRELRTRLEAMAELQKENDRLNDLLGFKAKTKMDLVAAKVMSKDLVSDHNTLRINKGTHDGLKAGQAVITTGGVVGYIYRPQAFTSQVLLVTDRYSVVDGVVARSRARGIVEGKNSSSCALRYVERSEDVKVGDLVVTSGLDNIFPKGFPVATVESVENKSYLVSLKVELKPIVDPDKVEEVFVISSAANEDLSNRLPPTATEQAPPAAATPEVNGHSTVAAATAQATTAPAAKQNKPAATKPAAATHAKAQAERTE